MFLHKAFFFNLQLGYVNQKYLTNSKLASSNAIKAND